MLQAQLSESTCTFALVRFFTHVYVPRAAKGLQAELGIVLKSLCKGNKQLEDRVRKEGTLLYSILRDRHYDAEVDLNGPARLESRRLSESQVRLMLTVCVCVCVCVCVVAVGVHEE